MSKDTESGEPGEPEETDGAGAAQEVQESLQKSRERLEEGADEVVESFDEGIVDLLSWVLDTETRARIYVYLRQHPHSTSEEIAEGTGLYPSTVREALAELADEQKVSRRKRESEGAGNNPYEYEAIAPSDLVGGMVGDVQNELNTVFNLDSYLGSEEETVETDSQPINITVEEKPAGTPDGDGSEGPDDEDEPERPGTGEEAAIADDESDESDDGT